MGKNILYEKFCIPTVTAIVERKDRNGIEIVIQERYKPDSDPEFSGLIELPGGKVRAHESVLDALRREVPEETGLEVTKIFGESITYSCDKRAMTCFPLFHQQMLIGGQPWSGPVFRVNAKGKLLEEGDGTRDIRWSSLEDIFKLIRISPELFFPYAQVALKTYLVLEGY